MRLLSQGATPILKFGNAGPYVRRVQRTLNAADGRTLVASGVFNAATDRAVRAWQQRVGIRASGVMNTASWTALQSARR